tara:strand:+ start:1115 stop:1384 length:270 start_codon:yes stop_codon:yes gene_type:complete
VLLVILWYSKSKRFAIKSKNYRIMSKPWQDKAEGNWNIAKGKLKQKWGDLTDDDLDYKEGKEDELLGRIQKKTGESKSKINEFLEELKY